MNIVQNAQQNIEQLYCINSDSDNNLPELIDHLIAAQMTIEESSQYSNSSKRIFLSRLRQFVQYVAEQNIHASLNDYQHIALEFIEYSRKKLNWKSTTVNNFTRTFRAYARILSVPFEKGMEAETDVSRTLLSLEHEQRLLHQCRTKTSQRETLLCLLFLHTTIGLTEATEIKMDDFSILEADSALLRIKKRHQGVRVATLNQELTEALTVWLAERNKLEAAETSPYLFFGPRGDKLTTSAVDIMIRKTGWRAGLNLSVQTLRNTRKKKARQTA